MNAEAPDQEGPDLAQGVALSSLADGAILRGHAQGEKVLLVRRGDEVFAIGGTCTHYGAPLEEGLVVGETLRCEWHHACFSLRSGEALRAPALDSVPCWRVELRDGMAFVREKRDAFHPIPAPAIEEAPRPIVIVGGGGAGNAAAEMLRREGFAGRVTMLSADTALPCDRPNLSKDYLSGNVDENMVPLRSAQFYRDHDIDLRLNTRVARIDTRARSVLLEDGGNLRYDTLLLATGAEPIRLDIPGGDLPHVRTLRSVADSRALIDRAHTARHAVVIGSSFIGLEVTSSLRQRGLEVQVVTQESCPMLRVLGVEVGRFVQALHEQHGVVFHLGTTATSIDAHDVTLADGTKLPADLVVVGIGVRPEVALAEQAGIAVDRGVTVDAYLETSAPGVFAAGDIARWPDRLSGERIRIEHWVVAERQGQTAARNMLGERERFDCVPFFWTVQYDFGFGYVGHAEHWDSVKIDGSLEARDCTISYRRNGRQLALGIVQRDLDGLKAELAFEQEMAQHDDPSTVRMKPL